MYIKKNLITVLEDIRLRNITQIAVTGDIAEKNDECAWFFDTIKEYGFEMHPVLENHDNPSAMELAQENMHGSLYYCEQTTLLVCDTREAFLDDEQLNWLVMEIHESTLALLIFIHHPVLDCDDSSMDLTYALKNREEIRTALHKEVHLFCGHYHTTDEHSDGCIHQYITPSIFDQIKKYSETLERDDKPFGYRIINLDRRVSSQISTFGT